MMNELDGRNLVDPAAYAEHGYPHDLWKELRQTSPLHRFDLPGWRPFWAVTKHADICEISKQPALFTNHPRITISRLEIERAAEEGRKGGGGSFAGMRTIINMDGGDHRKLRKVASPLFSPNALKRLGAVIEQTARDVVDSMPVSAHGEGECDFITQVANVHPLKIICRILGMPESDEPLILRLTNELFGGEDPEFQRDPDHEKRTMALGLEMYEYFSRVIADRRANPSEDLASVIANARVDGEPLSEGDTLGYFLITFTAGHETTRGAIGGGLHALIQNPEQREKLAGDASLIPSAIDEILRFVTPVNTMVRTAQRDYSLRGQTIRRGDTLVLFYASANRDEEVFEDPDTFRIARARNRHLGFGIGEHFCLGANLAKRTSGALFAELVPRLESIELVGEPERVASNLVPGIKHLPIRYRLRPAQAG